MIIKKEIELELEKISIDKDPINEKGKFINFSFRMTHPHESSFFKKRTVKSDDFSVIWGQHPNITFYQKNYKPFEKQMLALIKENLPDGLILDDLEWWHLQILDYTSPKDDRKWGVCYRVKSAAAHKDGHHIYLVGEGCFPVSSNTMSRLFAELHETFAKEMKPYNLSDPQNW